MQGSIYLTVPLPLSGGENKNQNREGEKLKFTRFYQESYSFLFPVLVFC